MGHRGGPLFRDGVRLGGLLGITRGGGETRLFFMKWIFALLFVFSYSSFAVESSPATYVDGKPDLSVPVKCQYKSSSSVFYNGLLTIPNCLELLKTQLPAGYSFVGYTSSLPDFSVVQIAAFNVFSTVFRSSDSKEIPNYRFVTFNNNTLPLISGYQCLNPNFPVGPVDLNGSKVCQAVPKVCKMGAIVRIQSNGKEICVPNCGAAAGLTNSSQFFYQAGPTVGSTAGEIKCFGQCSITTVGSSVQLSSGAWTGSYTFSGATCPVVRPEPVSSESELAGGTPSQPVDESTASQGTTDSLNQLANAASSATNTPVQPTATGPDNTATLKDVTKTIADSANAQIKATSSQNTATGNLLSNISKDLQNAIIKSGSGGGGGGASASLQAQANGKLDGIKNALDGISDKLDEPGQDGPFTPGTGSGAFWEDVLPESSFTDIKDKTAASVQKMKDLSTQFQDSVSFTNLSASGEPDEWSLNIHGEAMPFGLGAFQLLLDMGLSAIILFLCALYAIYIITNRK